MNETTDAAELVDVVRRLHQLDGCELGGPLHIITDDLNTRDDDINWCRDKMDEWFDKWYDGNQQKEARLLALIIIDLLFKVPEADREPLLLQARSAVVSDE